MILICVANMSKNFFPMFRDRDIVGIEPTLTFISFIKYQDKSIKYQDDLHDVYLHRPLSYVSYLMSCVCKLWRISESNR